MRMRKDDVLPLLGEGFLMALRRAVPDSLVASKIHGLITKMPDEDWEAVLDFVYDCIKPALSDCETIFPPRETANRNYERVVVTSLLSLGQTHFSSSSIPLPKNGSFFFLRSVFSIRRIMAYLW